MSDPTAGTRGFVAGLIKAVTLLHEGKGWADIQAVIDALQARDSAGPVHWMTQDGIAVWVQPENSVWLSIVRGPDGDRRCWPHDNRAAALADIETLLAEVRDDRRIGP